MTDPRILRNKEKYENKIYTNSFGTQFKIITYKDNRNILIEFQDEYKYQKWIDLKLISQGSVSNPYDKKIFGVGYYGFDRMCKQDNDDEYIHCYNIWYSMLERCYDINVQKKQPTYKGCKVCDEWLDLSNFYKWYKQHIITVNNNEKICLDKDILIKGNKIYSPSTCCFVPNEINVLFTKTNAKRGNYPIGVYYKNKNHKFCAQCKIGGGKPQKYLGLFNTVEEAFYTYKAFKEQYIKQIADKYKGQIEDKVYDALYNYKVEITD